MRLLFYKDFFDLVFPRSCSLCSKSLHDFENTLCMECKESLPETNYHLRPGVNDLTQKIKGLTDVKWVISFLRFTKSGQSQSLLHKIKYKNQPKLAIELGTAFGRKISKTENLMADILIPVPLHPLKHRRRGYNQSEKFAEGIAQTLNIPVVRALERIKFTETQTKKSRLQRLSNVEGVFCCKTDEQVRSKSIFLVDDVMTTGATLSACANELLRVGAKDVSFLTIAAGS